MEITIKGSPTELAELLAGLRTEQPAEEKKGAPQSGAAEQSIDFEANRVLDKINKSASKVTNKALRI